MQVRPDLTEQAQGLEVYQLTNDSVPSCHVYMEAQIFLPDCKRFVLHRSAGPHGGSQYDPEHRYLLCDLDDNGAFIPLTEEDCVTGPSVSPDGAWLYYFEDKTAVNGGTLALKRVRTDGTSRETVAVLDGPIPGTGYRPSNIYPLSTISSDGHRLATAAFLGDGKTEDAPWGLIVFNLENGAVSLALEGPTWLNLHPQYCRAVHEASAHDVMVQENHGGKVDMQGVCTTLVSGDGADIHLIRDDGTNFRSFPWGRDGREMCQGHQCWRGRGRTAITSLVLSGDARKDLIESPPCEFAGHVGIASPGGKRNVLTRECPAPRFYHFATDIAGSLFVSDARGEDGKWTLYTARFGEYEGDPLYDWRFILDTGSSDRMHPHPFLSPDGKWGFFNSDESGVLQAYAFKTGW